MKRIRKTLFTRTPREWLEKLRRIQPWTVRVWVFRICWFDYIAESRWPDFGRKTLKIDTTAWEPPPPERIEEELLLLGYPRARARKRAYCWAPRQPERGGEGSRGDAGEERPGRSSSTPAGYGGQGGLGQSPVPQESPLEKERRERGSGGEGGVLVPGNGWEKGGKGEGGANGGPSPSAA